MKRTIPTILAAAAIAVAPIAIFTTASAHAWPACTGATGNSLLSCEQACDELHGSQGACNVPPRGVVTGCVGSANDCGNRIAACAAGLGPCPYSYRIKPNSYYRTSCETVPVGPGRDACEKVCAHPGTIGCSSGYGTGSPPPVDENDPNNCVTHFYNNCPPCLDPRGLPIGSNGGVLQPVLPCDHSAI
jgi:hypothetical protein